MSGPILMQSENGPGGIRPWELAEEIIELRAENAALRGERDAANQHCKILMAANHGHARLIEQQMKELAALREDKMLLDKLDVLISTEETQRLFLLPTRRDCYAIREALRVATSCHVPEEAQP